MSKLSPPSFSLPLVFCLISPQVFALICDVDNPQVFTVEFIRGQIRKYSSTERYTDVTHTLFFMFVVTLQALGLFGSILSFFCTVYLIRKMSNLLVCMCLLHVLNSFLLLCAHCSFSVTQIICNAFSLSLFVCVSVGTPC